MAWCLVARSLCFSRVRVRQSPPHSLVGAGPADGPRREATNLAGKRFAEAAGSATCEEPTRGGRARQSCREQG